jgi:hypothetical protein
VEEILQNHSSGSLMKTIMTLRFRRRRSDVKQIVGRFRDSGDGYRVQSEDGTDLGFFGPGVYRSIIFEIRYDEPSHALKSNVLALADPRKEVEVA